MRVGVDGDRVLPILRAQISYYATTNIVSLNDNTNVRKCLNENIYTPGVFAFGNEGGVFLWICFGRVD